MALNLTGNREDWRALDVELDDGVEASLRMKHAVQITDSDMDRLGFDGRSIDDPRYATVAAEALGRTGS
jgi:hypothetical protein